MITIIKRNGSLVPFEKDKVITAINNAFIEVDKILYETDTSKSIADDIEKIAAAANKNLTVEEIQDLVEKFLMKSDRPDVARAYIRYRYRKEIARNYSNELIDTVRQRLSGKINKKSNANVDEESFGGRIGEAGDVIWRNIALDYIMSQKAKNNHLNNRIYIHDLNSYAIGNHNCLSIPFDDLLAKGFKTRQTDVRPAGSINTAFQLVAVIFQLQSLQQFGGVAATHLDWTMVPYVRKSFRKHWNEGIEFIGKELCPDIHWIYEKENKPIDEYCSEDDFAPIFNYAWKMTEKETYQAAEGLYHNLNTLQSRSGNQLPFTSINYGTCVLPEGRMVIKALLEVSIEGLGSKGQTSIFPCSIFQVGKGINRYPNDPNYDLFQLALKSTAQRLYPNYANIDWSGNSGYDPDDPTTYFSTMGKCKLQPM